MSNAFYAVPADGGNHPRMFGIAHTQSTAATTVASSAMLKILLQTLTTVTKFWADFSQFAATSTHKLVSSNKR